MKHQSRHISSSFIGGDAALLLLRVAAFFSRENLIASQRSFERHFPLAFFRTTGHHDWIICLQACNAHHLIVLRSFSLF